MWNLRGLAFCALTLFAIPAWADQHDSRLYGTWRVTTYVVQGVAHPAKGLVVITERYFLSNAVFDLDSATGPQANANAGPYRLDGEKIVLLQEMQLHWRPGRASNESFLRQDVEETFPYVFSGRNLTFSFPSGNRYVLERAP